MKRRRSLYGSLLVILALLAPAGSRAGVVFSGLAADQEQNARALMPLASASCDSARWRVDRLFRGSDASLQNALEALGYYDSTISKTLDWSGECWEARFEVFAGEPVLLRNVDIRITGEAGTEPAFSAAIPADQPSPGERFDHGRYERYKADLVNAAFSFGYFDAVLGRKEVFVDKPARSADMYLQLDSGPRYRFGEILFAQGTIRDDLLRRYGEFASGDPYRADAVSGLAGDLRSSGYFESVEIQTEPLDRAAKTVPVKVNLAPGKRKIYSAGIGYSTDLGPQGKLAYIDRRRNQKGHQFESRMTASPVKSTLTFSYRLPHGDPRREWFSFVGGFQNEETDTSESDRFKLGLLQTKKRSNRWLETRYIDYAQEDFTVSDQQDSSRLLILGANWGSVTGDELSRTRNGTRLNFDIRGASDALGSDTDFLQFRATFRWIRSLGDHSRVLTRMKLGATAADLLEDLPPSVRFFSGGDHSVRGYGFETLGPRDSSGSVTGGSNLVEASVEIERVIRDQWAVAAFVDSGSAFNHSDLDLSTGIGIGVRWYSPVGPIRLDIAHPLDESSRSLRLHFTLGPDL